MMRLIYAIIVLLVLVVLKLQPFYDCSQGASKLWHRLMHKEV